MYYQHDINTIIHKISYSNEKKYIQYRIDIEECYIVDINSMSALPYIKQKASNQYRIHIGGRTGIFPISIKYSIL